MDGSSSGLLHALCKFTKKFIVQIVLRLSAHFYCILKIRIASQIVAPSLKADHCPPSVLTRHPVYARYAAGVVASYCLCLKHLYTSTIYIGKPQRSFARYSARRHASTAGGMPAPQAVCLDNSFFSTFTLAPPCCPASDILCRTYDGQLSIFLSCQLQLFG